MSTTHRTRAVLLACLTATILCFNQTSQVVSAADAAGEQNASPFAENAVFTHRYEDGAEVSIPREWKQGTTLKITGKDWFTANGAPSVIAFKLDMGNVNREDAKYGNPSIWEQAAAEADGTFSIELAWPTTQNSDIDPSDWTANTLHNVVLLTGSLADGDIARGGKAADGVKIIAGEIPTPSTEPTPQPSPAPQPAPQPGPSQQPNPPLDADPQQSNGSKKPEVQWQEISSESGPLSTLLGLLATGIATTVIGTAVWRYIQTFSGFAVPTLTQLMKKAR